MFIKQLSVFVENREGRLGEALKILKDENINIVSLSLADSSDYGMLRMIVSDAENGAKVLKENGFAAMTTDVLAVKMEHKVGQLQHILDIICKAGINIEYMYALATGTKDASIAIKTSKPDEALELLENAEVSFITSEDIVNFNM